jgi:hypothetical protein
LTLCQAQVDFSVSISQHGFVALACTAFGVGELVFPKMPPLKQPKLKAIHSIKNHFIKRERKQVESKVKTTNLDNLSEETIPIGVELESNDIKRMSFQSNTGRSVVVGRDLSTRPILVDFDGKPDVSIETDNRILVPEEINRTPFTNTGVIKATNRLYCLFQRAAYKVVYRIRADNRIKLLKAQKIETSLESTVNQLEKKFVIVPPLPPKGNCVDSTPVQINIPEPPDLLAPRPVKLIVPSYAEKMGYKDIPRPQNNLSFQVYAPRPKIQPPGISC